MNDEQINNMFQLLDQICLDNEYIVKQNITIISMLKEVIKT